MDILNYFSILKDQETIGSSYLFVGGDFLLVQDVFRTINCQKEKNFCGICWDCKKIKEMNHPDLFIVEPEGMTTKISAIRGINQFLSLKSFRAPYKIVIIKDGLSLSTDAANAFLKTLEEPPHNSFIAICTPKIEGLLPTIVSRCRKIFLPCAGNSSGFTNSLDVIDFVNGKKMEFRDRRKFSVFLWEFILFLRGTLTNKAGYQKGANGLCKYPESWKFYSVKQISCMLQNASRIYESRGNININLALELIRAEF